MNYYQIILTDLVKACIVASFNILKYYLFLLKYNMYRVKVQYPLEIFIFDYSVSGNFY